MENRRQFEINFKGLSLGEHKYHYDIKPTFFEEFDLFEINDCNLTVELLFTKDNRIMHLDFSIHGTINIECDRCLESYDEAIHTQQNLIVKIATQQEELDDNLITISEQDYMIDIKHFIYEYIALSLPMRKVHPDTSEGLPGCNEAVNAMLSTPEEIESIDPRWDALKKLKNK